MDRSFIIEFESNKKLVTVQFIHVPEERMTACFILVDRDVENACFSGVAKRNPADVDDPEIGMRLAMRRALKHLRWSASDAGYWEVSHNIRKALRERTELRKATLGEESHE